MREMTSDNDGLAACTLNLLISGQHYEEQHRRGFVSSDEVLNLDVYQGQDVEDSKLKQKKNPADNS